MKSAYKIGYLTFLLTFLVSTSSAAHNFGDLTKQEFTKNIKKEFAISADGTTGLHNQYGQIEVKTWDKNRVKIDVLIRVKARSESEAQKIFDRIAIDFANTPNMVRAETKIESGNWKSWSGGNADYNIDYQVFMPSSVALDLSNKYGNTQVEALNANATINVKYGNFDLEGIGGKLNINLGYGNGTVENAANVDAKLSYSKFGMKAANDINFDTKYSKIAVEKGGNINVSSRYDSYTLGDIQDLNTEGKYDNYEVKSVDNIVATSKYTDFRIGKIENSAELNLEYGGAQFGKIAKGFAYIHLKGRYTNYKMQVEQGAAYQLDASTDYAGIGYPSTMKVMREREHGTSHQVAGYVGVQGARSIITANLNYGGLKVE